MIGKRMFANRLRCLVASAALVLSACAESPSLIRVAVDAPMIVNGERVSADDWVAKSTVALVMAKNEKIMGICTGTLIFPKVILTAAHCLDEKPDRVVAVFAPQIQGVARERTRTASSWEQHPDWGKSSESGRADIALVKLDGDHPTGAVVAKPLPSSIQLKENDEFVIAGYGLSIAYIKTGQGILRKAKSTILGAMSPSEIVTDGSKSSICFGDSGGPAYLERNGEAYIWGVASAVSSEDCDEMSVHTDLLSHSSWIVRTATKLAR